MSSDIDYVAFLEKSQKDYSQPGTPAAAASVTAMATATNTRVHPAVKALGERYYISDADEPFEGISFAWEKETFPSEGLFFLTLHLIGPLRIRGTLKPKRKGSIAYFHGQFSELF